MSRYLTELVGTLFLVLIIGLAVAYAGALAPVAIGCGLMVLVYMGGHHSGAHYNPAVTLAMVLRKELPGSDAVPYVIAQLVGGLLGAALALAIVGESFAPPPDEMRLGAALVAEVAFTFLLVLVILNVATDPKIEGNQFYGLAIGFTVLVGAFTVGGVSGGVFNPAVGIGSIVVDTIDEGSSIGDIWLYIVAPCVGSVIAVIVYGLQRAKPVESDD